MKLLKKDILYWGLTISFILSLFSTSYSKANPSPIPFMDVEYIRFLIYFISLLSLFVHFMYNGIVIKKRYLITLIICSAGLIVLGFFREEIDVSYISRFIVLLPFFFLDHQIDGKKYIKKGILIAIIIYSILLSAMSGFLFDGNRFIFNSHDPNFSAIYFLFGFMISDKLKYNGLKYIFIFLGLLTFSRNFILAIILFYAIRYLKNTKIATFFFTKTKPFFIFILLQIVIVLFGGWFLLNVEIEEGRSSISLNDGSNQLRFFYSSQGVIYLLSGKEAIIDGAGEHYWNDGKTPGKANTSGAVHNSFLELLVTKGIIYGMLNMIFLFAIVHQNYRKDNYEFIYPFLIASLFLGLLFGGVFLYIWSYILNTKKEIT